MGELEFLGVRPGRGGIRGTGGSPCLFQAQGTPWRGQRSPLRAQWQREAGGCQGCLQLPQPPPPQGNSSCGQWIAGFTTHRELWKCFLSQPCLHPCCSRDTSLSRSCFRVQMQTSEAQMMLRSSLAEREKKISPWFHTSTCTRPGSKSLGT